MLIWERTEMGSGMIARVKTECEDGTPVTIFRVGATDNAYDVQTVDGYVLERGDATSLEDAQLRGTRALKRIGDLISARAKF